MNTFRQFWTLVKFHASVNPFIGFMLIAFGAQPVIANTVFTSGDYHPNLSSLLFVPNLFFVYLIGLWIIVPDMAQSWGKNSAWSSGTEFLLSRAIEKRFVYRTRAFLLYIVILVIPVVSLLYSLKYPDIKVTEYSTPARQLCLQSVAGSSLSPGPNGIKFPLIFLPFGNVLVEQWHVWLFVASGLLAQGVLMLIYPLRYRQFIFYGVFLGSIFAQLVVDLRRSNSGLIPLDEKLFFLFAAHQVVFWGLTALALVACQVFFERRFAVQEH